MRKPVKPAPPPAALPEPNERLVQAMAEARTRTLERPVRPGVRIVEGADGKMSVSPANAGSDPDRDGWACQLADVFATASPEMVSASLDQLVKIGTGNEIAVGGLLAIVSACAPQNELETAIAVQIATNHSLSQCLLQRAVTCEGTALREANVGMATKLSRTMLASVDALHKLRGGGKQQVEVRHVYINGNAVVGDVHTGGAGANERNGHRPFE